MAPPGANYSGLMECPCTTRTTRVLTGYTTVNANTCAKSVSSADECFNAVSTLVQGVMLNVTTNSTTSPQGCFIISHTGGYEAHYNPLASAAACGAAAGAVVRATGSEQSQVYVGLDVDGTTGNVTITLKAPAGVWFGVGFGATVMNDQPWTIVVDGDGAVTERKLANHESGYVLAPSVEVIASSVGPAVVPSAMRNHWGYPTDTVNTTTKEACQQKCEETARCRAWTFAPPHFTTPYNLEDAACILRFGLSSADGANSGFTPVGWHDGMWSSELSADSVRTVVLRRALKGLTAEYYTFDPRAVAVPFINAVGTTKDLSYHGGTNRSGSAVMLVEVGAPVCICRSDQISGSINGIPWADNCAAFPDTTIARDNNPSCSIATYNGGMICCHHAVHLLDAEQTVPPPLFTYRMKFRFYYEDPTDLPAQPYQNAFFMFRETEVAHGEYDVPKCAAGTPAEECVHTVTGTFLVKDAMRQCNDRSAVWCSPSKGAYPQSPFVQLLHISPHCHGPACISMEFIAHIDGKDVSLCKSHPVYGQGDAPMDESGYIAGILPCVWGSAAEGLAAPPVLSLDTNVTVIKKANSTNFHYGVMGHWQIRGAWADGPAHA